MFGFNASVIANTYNSLPELFAASAALEKRSRLNAVDPLLAIVRRFELDHLVGIRLLHRHNSITSGEFMGEYFAFDEEGFALITKATSIEEAGADYIPNSWALTNQGFVPVEFSLRQLVRGPDVNPSTHKSFFDELAFAIAELQLSEILGPSLLGSEFIDRNRPEGSKMMIEKSALDDRANVLRFAFQEEIVGFSGAETHWCVGTDNENEDEPKKTVPLTTCTKICPYVQNPPVHQGTYIHNQT